MFNVRINNSATGRVFKYKSRITGDVTTFYADRGIVRIVNEQTGEFESVSRLEFLLRAAAINNSLKVKQPSDEKLDQQRMVEAMIAAARAAKDQGDPLDPVTSEAAFAQAKAAAPTIVGAFSGQPQGSIFGRIGAWESSPMPPAPKADPNKPAVPLSETGGTRLIIPK
jgi:hypothetical protein